MLKLLDDKIGCPLLPHLRRRSIARSWCGKEERGSAHFVAALATRPSMQLRFVLFPFCSYLYLRGASQAEVPSSWHFPGGRRTRYAVFGRLHILYVHISERERQKRQERERESLFLQGRYRKMKAGGECRGGITWPKDTE